MELPHTLLSVFVMLPLDDNPLQRVLGIIHDLAPESYVVGGAVRDVLSGVAPFADLDVAVPGDGCQVARAAADILGSICSFVPLDPERGTARLVLKTQVAPAVDISTFKGATIEQDLLKRDFTINAMAVSASEFRSGAVGELIDPCHGAADLRSKTVRACSAQSFVDDPLRVLRAFRFAGILKFSIDPDTLRLMRGSVGDLNSVAGERIRDELFAILAMDGSFPSLQLMDDMGIVHALFPEFIPMKGCSQNEYHHLDVWAHSLETVRTMEEILRGQAASLAAFPMALDRYVSEDLVAGRPRRALLKLAALFHDAGKPVSRFVDERGKVRFFGHEKMSGPIFQEVAERLKLSGKEIQVGSTWIQGHMRPIALFNDAVTRRMAYRLWKTFGEEIPGLFVLFLADLAATRGPARELRSDEHVYQSVRTVLTLAKELQETPSKPLVNGRDLMNELELPPGPRLGRILGRLAEMQASAEISSREEAIAEAKKLAHALPEQETRFAE